MTTGEGEIRISATRAEAAMSPGMCGFGSPGLPSGVPVASGTGASAADEEVSAGRSGKAPAGGSWEVEAEQAASRMAKVVMVSVRTWPGSLLVVGINAAAAA